MADQRQAHTVGKAGNGVGRYFRRLRDDAPVEYCVEACQPAHSRYSDCRQCERSCPVNALQVVEGGVEVDTSCIGCGRCAAACPAGALGISGFALPEIATGQSEPLFVDCWKVSVTDSPKDAVRVPCLGGLSQSRLAAMHVAAGARPVILLDRGWCGTCAAGAGDAHPASKSTNAVRELLQTMNIPSSQWPAIGARPLSPTRQAPGSPDRASEQRLSRRAFFGDLAARATNAASEINPLTSGKQPSVARGHEREPAPSRERDRLLAHVRVLAERNGVTMPASLYPAVRIDARRCAHHQLCAATCPTGALKAFDTAGVSGVVFDSSGCIACGHCETICPEQALQLLPRGDGHAPVGPTVLVRIRQRECASCGRPFEGAPEDTLCASCGKRSALAASAFHTLFGRPG